MSEFQEPNYQTTTTVGTPRWVGLAVAVLGVISILGLGVGYTALNQAKSVGQASEASLKQTNDALSQRLAKSEEANQQLQSDLKVVTDKLNVTQSDLLAARQQSKSAVVAYDRKLNGLKTDVSTQLATKASTDDVSKLNGDVNGVKTGLDATNNNLQMARSEMGTLIARNHDEIDQLRRMGQRDYYEFSVTKKGGTQKVGSIQVELRDTNTKKNQYTINVLTDDKSFEKKNRSVNEPMYFFEGGSRKPLEFVVNSVGKDKITGYLSAPKSVPTSAAQNTSGGN